LVVLYEDNNLHHVCLSAWNTSDPTGGIFVKFDTEFYMFSFCAF